VNGTSSSLTCSSTRIPTTVLFSGAAETPPIDETCVVSDTETGLIFQKIAYFVTSKPISDFENDEVDVFQFVFTQGAAGKWAYRYGNDVLVVHGDIVDGVMTNPTLTAESSYTGAVPLDDLLHVQVTNATTSPLCEVGFFQCTVRSQMMQLFSI